MVKITNLGFPNVYKSLIKKAVEGFWRGEKSEKDILEAKRLVEMFNAQQQSQLDLRPVGDIDIYDRLLKTAVTFGITASRFGTAEKVNQNLETYLSIPRGTEDAPASPMVKWFNTNYHVVQPEIEQLPNLVSSPDLPDLSNPNTKLALIGPWTLLSYSINNTNKTKEELFAVLAKQYVSLINNLPYRTVQLEEPSFLTHNIPEGYEKFCESLNRIVHLHTYFGSITNLSDRLFNLSVEGIGIDFFDSVSNIDEISKFPDDKILIAGIINGRNVWPTSTKTKELYESILEMIPGERLYISPSCSLMHVPLTAERERGDFAFAKEKLKELIDIKNGIIQYNEVDHTKGYLPTEEFRRSRKDLWVSEIPYPTTTIGSFPQTPEVRKTRREWKKGEISGEKYKIFMRGRIKECIKKQEKIGLDVLVHGEFERADMVQYFAELLDGFTALSIRAAVQSYGTRFVRPPVITGPISRPNPMTVEWSEYAQSLTDKPVKGMLTGPVTMVQWAYPREDISKEAQFYDVASALAKEVDDLVAKGIAHIQIDEPALREGLPINQLKRAEYLFHAVNAFRQVYANTPDHVVIHSHMCFSEFPDIMEAIKSMGVDVLSIEDSKAKGKTSASLRDGGFPGSIGLGVYDVHSPRMPKIDEMLVIPDSLNMDPRKVWINPDCGLKTRGEEAYHQLAQMMRITYILRDGLGQD